LNSIYFSPKNRTKLTKTHSNLNAQGKYSDALLNTSVKVGLYPQTSRAYYFN